MCQSLCQVAVRSVSGLRNGCPHIIQSQRCILQVLSYHSPHIFGTVTYPGGMSALGQVCVTDRHLNCFKRTNHSALFRKCCDMIRSHVLCLSLYTWQVYQGCTRPEHSVSFPKTRRLAHHSPWNTDRHKSVRHCKTKT